MTPATATFLLLLVIPWTYSQVSETQAPDAGTSAAVVIGERGEGTPGPGPAPGPAPAPASTSTSSGAAGAGGAVSGVGVAVPDGDSSGVVAVAGSGSGAAATSALRAALRWLRRRRDTRDGAWGNHTAAAVLALQLARRPRAEHVESGTLLKNSSSVPKEWASPSNPEGLLSVKQMELELVLHLWRWKNVLLRIQNAANSRHHEAPITSGKLAQYTLALNAVCKDPKKFYGHDLINMLQHHEAELDYEFAFSSLAVCSSGTHVRKRQIRRLLDIADRVNDHNVDTLSMVLLALKCIVQEHRNRNLNQYIKKPTSGLAQQQQPDGSFVGSLHSTALAMQALGASGEENESWDGYWNRSAAIKFLCSRQGADGSFIDVPTTAEVILALGPHTLGAVHDSNCPTQSAVKFLPPQLLPELMSKTNHHHPHHKHAPIDNNVKSFTSPSSSGSHIIGTESGHDTNKGTTISSPALTSTPVASSTTSTMSVTTASSNSNVSTSSVNKISFGTGINLTSLESLAGLGRKPDLVKVSYTIWVHSNISESYFLTVQTEQNTTFYNVMLLAAQEDPHYQFEATEWPNGHYVHTLAGYKEEPTSYYFWLLYQTTELPDPSNPPGNQLITPVGVDGLLVNDGNHFLFWYKKL